MILYISSHTISITVLSAFYHSLHDIAFLTLCVLGTSLVYWKNPKENSWIQFIDRIFVRCSFLYIFYETMQIDENIVHYYVSVSMGIISYLLAKWYSPRSKYLSNFIHCGLHFFGNISNVIIFPYISVKRKKVECC